jgi:hypothetical protein
MRQRALSNIEDLSEEVALLSGNAWTVGSFEVTPEGKVTFFVSSKQIPEGRDYLFSFQVVKQFAENKVREINLKVSNQNNHESFTLRDSKEIRTLYSKVSAAIVRTSPKGSAWVKFLQNQ